MMKHLTWILLAVLVLASCTVPETASKEWSDYNVHDPGITLLEEGELRSFDSPEELKTFVIANQGGTSYYGAERMALSADMAVAESTAGSSLDYSKTNVQVAGIDEGDILKTDGEYIYTITDNTLFIIEAGEDASVVSQVEFDNRPSGLFVDGDRLAIFGNAYKGLEFSIVPRYGMTTYMIYDISNREEPELVKEYAFEGQYFESRMKDGTVYFLVRSGLESRPVPMPLVMEDGVERSVPVSDIYYYPYPYNNPEFVTVHTITFDGDLDTTTVAVEGGQTVYMSHENLYIASTEWVNKWELRQEITVELMRGLLSEEDRELVRKIERVDPAILSPSEKEAKIYQIYSLYIQYMDDEERDTLEEEVEDELEERIAKYESREYTVIHKLSLGDTVRPVATGTIPGRLNNQFAMDEYEGVLRLATTLSPFNQWWGAEPMIIEDVVVETRVVEPRSTTENRVYTLGEDLDVMDVLDGVAEGESIFASRFIGDRLYLVTFRQVDPFFVIDLSDPTDIETLGELKIPGFSRYLHPYDEDHIIGIGRDASATGRQEGIKISLFDVSDVEHPEEVASWIADEKYSQSSAEWEHKAFLFSREKNLLVIPGYNYHYRDVGQQYNGAMVFYIDTEDIELRGIIDHSEGNQRYSPSVERSLFIGDLLYTKSPYLLRVNDLDSLEGVQRVDLKPGKTGPYPVY